MLNYSTEGPRVERIIFGRRYSLFIPTVFLILFSLPSLIGKLDFFFVRTSAVKCGPDSSVGTATGYGLEGPGIEFRWGRDFSPVQTGPGAHPASCKMGTGSSSGIKWPGRDADPSPLSSVVVKKE